MNTQKYHFAIVVLLLGVVLLPVTKASQSADRDLGIVRLRYVTIVVRNYDEALKWHTNVLGLEKTEDGTFGLDKRWLVVAPRGQKDFGIILEIAKPYSALDKGTNLSPATGNDPIRNYEARVGAETRWVFEVADCRKFYELASKRSVKFVEPPRRSAVGRDRGYVRGSLWQHLCGQELPAKNGQYQPTILLYGSLHFALPSWSSLRG